MTKKEFWTTLKKTKGWQLDDKNMIRNDGCCPIEYVANRKARKRKFDNAVYWAAEYLNLSEAFVDDIVNSADSDNTVYRTKLLKTCRLND